MGRKKTIFNKIVPVLLATCMTVSSVQIQTKADVIKPSQPLGVNVAKDAKLTIPGADDDTYKIVDGDLETGWQTNNVSSDAEDSLSDPQEWKLELEKTYTIDRINLYWEAACAKEYDIYVSETGEDDSWVKVAEETNGNSGKFEYKFDAIDAKYIKLDLKTRAMGYGYYLYEVEAITVGSTEEEITDNIAKNATATASSSSNESNSPDKAIDGNVDTLWQADISGTNEEKTNQYIQLTWDEEQVWDTVRVRWSGGYMKGYVVQTSSDGETWENVASVDNGKANDYKTIKLDKPVTSKYLRVQGTDFGAYYFEIRELEVYNESDIKAKEVLLNRDSIKLNLDSEEASYEKLDVAVNPSNTANKGIIWTSSNENVATVDQDGTVRAVGMGRAVITATSQSDENVKKTCDVIVSKGIEQPKLNVKLTSDKQYVTVTWNAVENAKEYVLERSLVGGEKEQIYTGTDTTFTDKNVDKKTYVYYLVAKAIDSEELCDSKESVSDEIIVPVRVTGVEFSANEEDIDVGDTVDLTAIVTPDDATDKSLEWNSSDSSIVSVNEYGKIKALKEGSATITATSVDDPSLSASIKINAKVVPMAELTLDKISDACEPEAEIKLTATYAPGNTTYTDLKWETSDDKVATVDNEGKVIAVAPGTATITVSSVAQPEIKAEFVITVKHFVTGIKLNKETLTLTQGKSETLTATVLPENATDKEFKWISSDNSVASVDETGKVSALKPGTVVIAAITNDGELVAECKVTVKAPVKVNPPVKKVTPAKVVISKVKKGKKKATITWKKAANAYGYQIYMKTGKGKYKLVKTLTNPKKLKFVKKKLKAKKTYTFKIRAFSMNGKTKVFGAYSSAKKVKIKK